MKPDETIKSWGATAPDAEEWIVSGYASWWSAAIEYACQEGHDSDDFEIEVHEEREPRQPEELINVGHVIDSMAGDGHEDYSFDFCDDFLRTITKEQKGELEAALQKAAGEWLDRHKLRPTWKVGGRSWVVTLGQAKARIVIVDGEIFVPQNGGTEAQPPETGVADKTTL